MTADTPYKIIQLACGKNQQGYITPDQYMLAINQGQLMFLNFLKGEYQKYQTGRPIAVVEFGQNQMIRQSLAPLIYGAILTANNISGISPFPSDFEFTDAMWGQYGFYNIRFIQQDRLASYHSSVIDPIATNPVYLIQHEGFQFYPETIGKLKLSYVRTPPKIIWAFIDDIHGRPIYDPINSIDPVWSDTDMFQIIVRALGIIGLNLQLSMVIQYAQEIKQNGE